MSSDGIVGWDIGGAHLKAAYLNGRGSLEHVLQIPCPLWQGLSCLDRALEEALQQLHAHADRHAVTHAVIHAVTMTGEMVDLFANRGEGVSRIIHSLSARLPVGRIRIYAGAAGFVTPDQGAAMVNEVSSANWLATATFIVPMVQQALLVDIGSTTTDIVALRGRVLARGRDDHRRLIFEELVYTGVTRTPVMAVAQRIPFAGEWVLPMAEHFATMADIYRLTGELPEDADQMPAADNGDKSLADSARRIARMLGRDGESAPLSAWRRAAEYVAELQQERIFAACARTLSRGLLDDGAPLIGAGVGRFLVRKLARQMSRPYVDFSTLIDCAVATGDWASHCASAVAVAALARAERPIECNS